MRFLRLLPILFAALLLAGNEVRFGDAPAAHAQTPGENGKIAFELNGGISTITPGTAGGTPLVTHGRLPAWSADGKKLAYVEDQKLVVINQNGTKLMDISVATGVSDPSWSPDGNHIVFGSSSDLYTVEVGQTTLFNLTNITNTPEIVEQDPDWGALGTRIAFVESNPNMPHRRLGLLSVTGGAVTFVSGAEGLVMPSWSPDEATFAFTRRPTLPQSTGEVSPQGDFADIFVVSANGGTPTNITNTAGSINEYSPSWSPDGTKIAYVHDEDANEKIRTMNPNGSGKADVTFGIAPAWQPIRQTIAGVEFTQGIQQLQSVFELQSDLAGDNMPPVPIVAGKPAAIRIYPEKVFTRQSFTLELDGGTPYPFTIDPACTVENRRKNETVSGVHCSAFEFYFTPPTGTWSKHIVVRDFANDIVFDETFTITSIETDSVILKAVSVCDTKGPGIFDPWECQDPARLMQIVSTLRKVLPTTNVNVALPGSQIRYNVADFATEGDWWVQVLIDLESMYGINDRFLASLGVETVYYGLTRNTVQGPAVYIRNKHVALSTANYTNLGYEAIQAIVMHGVGQALGLPYNNTSVPALSGGTGCQSRHIGPASWPYADNLLRSGAAPGEVEVGFDVFVAKPVPGDKVFDMMGLCFSPGPDTAWLSPFNLNKLLGPVGPLSSDAAAPQAIPASVPADFWLVAGTLDEQAADVGPLWTLELDLSVDAGSGSHKIEILDGSDGVLFTRSFTPAEVELPGDASPLTSTFSELIPVQAGAARLRILSDTQAVLADFPLTGEAPVVDSITLPATFSGVQSLSWTVSDPDGSGHSYLVDYSPNGGTTWVNLAMNLPDAGLAVDFDSLAAAEGNGVFRVIATDGVNSGELISAPFTVGAKAPHAEIIGPTETSFRAGSLVMLEAAAWDIDDGSLDGGSVTWSSDKDGALGSGAVLPMYELTTGTHQITMSAQDSDANVVTDTITIEVTNEPLSEGENNPGDTNCSGGADPSDALIIAAAVAGLDSGACQPIGEGDPMFGDADCSGALGPDDILIPLRFALDFAAGLPVSCKPYG